LISVRIIYWNVLRSTSLLLHLPGR